MYNKHIKFESDVGKAEWNLKKHGVDFETAQQVFYDEKAIIAPDTRHSQEESRWYAVGKIADGRIITVWFTKREEKIRIIGAAELRKWRMEYEKRKTAQP